MGILNGKNVLITGGTTGIGLASAILFQKEGAQIAVCGRNQSSLNAAAAALDGLGLTVQCDVTRLDELDHLISHVGQSFGHLDVLFANAGIARYGAIEDVTPEEFDHVFSINVRGLFFTVQKALPILRDGSVIILTCSIASKLGQPAMSVYAASKASIRSLVQTLSADLLPRRIRVLGLTPGPVDTPIFENAGLSPEEARAKLQQISKSVPIGRYGQADEIAQAALYLASDASSFMLGTEIVLDGGKSQL